MRITDAFELPGRAREVWQILTDPEALVACLPGATRVEAMSEDRYAVDLTVKLPFMSVRFKMVAELHPIAELAGLQVSLVGQPVALAGAMQANMMISLTEIEACGNAVTRVEYTLDMMLSGRLGSLGEAILRSSSRQAAAEFAARLGRRLGSADP